MTKPKHTTSTSSTKRIRIGTSRYLRGIHLAERLVPYIRLRGDRLSNAGFEPNDVVVVRVARGRLFITRA